MKNVAYTLSGNLFISVHNRNTVTEAEFPEILETFRRLDYEKVRMLVVTEGGGPTPIQRKEMNAALGGKEMPTAVVSDDIVIRGTVTALSWFNKKVRSFPASGLEEALEYLHVQASRMEAVLAEVEALRNSLRGGATRPRHVTLGR